MFSSEELFCSVDDFCQRFEPMWQQQLLTSGLQERGRERSRCLSEIMTMGNWVSPRARSHLQALLFGAGVRVLAKSVSKTCELQPLCQLDALGIAAAVCLPLA